MGHAQALTDRTTHQRPDPPTGPLSGEVVIAIDGPAGTGKSTVARLLAARLGLDFLDTGAMYRAAAAIAIDRGLDPANHEEIVRVVTEADIHFDWQQDPPTILAWMQPLNGRIRAAEVTRLVSRIAAIGPLRAHMVRKQRLIAQQHPRLVSEGRDQGSVVFPDAAVKFFLDAEPPVRARRRAEQLRAADPACIVDEAQLLQEIRERDALDSSRADGPLVCPDDAVRIDTGPLELTEVVDRLECIVRERLADQR